jgi:hypothetical protein
MEFKETGRDNGVCSVRKLQIFAELNGHALLGLTIETVSRLFALWKREDVIRERSTRISRLTTLTA